MNTASTRDLLRDASADGVVVIVAPNGHVRVRGRPEALERWRPVLRVRKQEILTDALKRAKRSLWPALERRSSQAHLTHYGAH
ncbi:MAG: hypothetical protein ABIR52_08505 [Casimicrobiaceae bacterium]